MWRKNPQSEPHQTKGWSENTWGQRPRCSWTQHIQTQRQDPAASSSTTSGQASFNQHLPPVLTDQTPGWLTPDSNQLLEKSLAEGFTSFFLAWPMNVPVVCSIKTWKQIITGVVLVSADCLSVVVTQMKIGTHFMTCFCRNAAHPKGFAHSL